MKMSLPIATSLILCGLGAAAAGSPPLPRIVTWPAPAGEPPSPDYAVSVNGQEVFCYTSYQFMEEAPTRLAGRPVSPLSFCSFDMEGAAEISVRFLGGLSQAGIDTSRVIIRPLAHGLRPAVEQGTVTFSIIEPCQLSIEPGGGLLHPLHIFANPTEADRPDPNDPKVHYFGPGEHTIRGVMLGEGETLYVAGGAIVHLQPEEEDALGESHSLYGQDLTTIGSMFESKWTKTITMRGRGILCGRRALERNQRGGHIRVQGIDGLRVEGLILRECSAWSLNIVNCRNVHVDGIKVVGHYVNNDGIVVGGTSDALVENCFSHNADDSLEVKVWIPQRNVHIRNCIVWNSLGGSLGLMHETDAEITNVLYENCTVIHSVDNMSVCPVIGLKLTGPGKASNFRFENIVVEDVVGTKRPVLKVINNWDDWHIQHPTQPDSPYQLLDPPVRDKPSGTINTVLFRNIRILNCRNTDVVLMADGPQSDIRNVTFENVVINGTPLVPGDPRIKTNTWVHDVRVVETR